MTRVTATPSRREAWERATNVPMLLLALIFLGTYAWYVLDTGASPHLDTWLARIDLVIWAAFAADFVIRMALSRDRWQFLRKHPLELLIVLVPPFRPLRLVRAALLMLGTLNRARLTRFRLSIYVGTSSLLVILLCSLAFFDAEYGAPDAKIQNYGDALWWSAVTVTTVGYGDYYPVTPEGRLVALILMTFGIGLIGFAIGTTTSWVFDQLKAVEASADQSERQLGTLLDEVRALRAEVAELRREPAAANGPPGAADDRPVGADPAPTG
ncbi:potassium channel family protein [Nocardia jiangsuensis]|uniref:Potassium channel family protein n=1 Tax=Nocardia jiangsuensis TaxID=1691563 RepID=A0ABV8DX27_9NOCA